LQQKASLKSYSALSGIVWLQWLDALALVAIRAHAHVVVEAALKMTKSDGLKPTETQKDRQMTLGACIAAAVGTTMSSSAEVLNRQDKI